MDQQKKQGVLDTGYAQQRREKPHLVFRYRTRAAVVAEAARKHLELSNSIRLLDMGCAEGITLLELRTLFGEQGEYTGVEFSDELLQMAPPMPDNVRLMQGDVAHLPDDVPENYYDIVSALAIFEHLDDPARTVAEAGRVLKPGGILVATSPSPIWDHIAGKLGLLKDDQHVTDINPDTFKSFLTSPELELIEYFQFMWGPLGFLPYLKIPVGVKFARQADNLISRFPFLNRMFVNQCFVVKRK